MHPTVFLVSAGIILLAVVFSLVLPENARELATVLQSMIASSTGCFFILVVNVCLVFAIAFLLSPAGRIRLVGTAARPEFAYLSLLAMLFSAGMGYGLVFFSVAEAVYHLASPPHRDVEAGTVEAARSAMKLTYFHSDFMHGVYMH